MLHAVISRAHRGPARSRINASLFFLQALASFNGALPVLTGCLFAVFRVCRTIFALAYITFMYARRERCICMLYSFVIQRFVLEISE